MVRSLRSRDKSALTKSLLTGVKKNDNSKRRVLSDQTNSQFVGDAITEIFETPKRKSTDSNIISCSSVTLNKENDDLPDSLNNISLTTAKDEKRIPIYKQKAPRRSLVRSPAVEQLYEFEVDENEPKGKKSRRKRIQKIKLVRPRRKKKPEEPILEPLCLESPNNFEKPTYSAVDNSVTSVDLDNNCVVYNGPENNSIKSSDFEIPILFNSPQRNGSSPMSDSLKAGHKISNFSTQSSFEQSSYTLVDLPASTPVKNHSFSSSGSINNTVITNFNASNCFGFDEPDLFEEPLISPIKISKENVDNVQKKTEDKKSVPVENIMKMLRFGGDPDISESCEVPHDNSNPEEVTFIPENFLDDPAMSSIQSKNPHRRSYERPFKSRRHDQSHELDSEEELDEKKKKYSRNITKKKNIQSKKEVLEMEEWIRSFNSQCQEVESFDLCVE